MSVATVVLRLRDEASAGLDKTTGSADKAAEAVDGLEDSAKGADGALGKLGGSADGVAPKLDDVGDSAKKARTGVDQLGDAGGAMGSNMAKARGILSLVSPELADLAGFGNDAGDAMEVASAGAAGLGVGLGPLALLLVAITGAATLGIGAWKAFGQAEADEARQVELNKATREALAPIVAAERDALLDLSVAYGDLSQAEADETRVRQAGTDQVLASTAANLDAIKAIRQQQAGYGALIGDMAEQADSVFGGYNFIAKAIGGLVKSTAELEQETVELHGANAELAEGVKKTTDAKVKAADATRRSTAASADETAALAAEAEAGRKAMDERDKAAAAKMRETTAMWAAVESGEVWYAQLLAGDDATAKANLAYEETIRQLQKLAQAQNDAGKSEAALTTLTEGQAKAEAVRAAAIAEGAAAEKKAAEDSAKAAIEAKTAADAAAASGVSGAAEAVADPLGYAASLNEYAGAIYSLAQAAAQLDQTMDGIYSVSTDSRGNKEMGGLLGGILNNINDDTGNKLGGWAGDVVGNVIPEILSTIPDFVAGLAGAAPDFIATIVESIPDVAMGIIEMFFLLGPKVGIAIWEGLIGEDWGQMGENFFMGFADGFVELWEGLVGDIGGALGFESASKDNPGFLSEDWMKQAGDTVQSWFEPTESYDTGSDYVARSGRAIVHAGERIIPATGAASQRTGAVMGTNVGGGVNIHMGNGMMFGTPDEMAREFTRHAKVRGIKWGG